MSFRIHILVALLLWVDPVGAMSERNKTGGPGYEPPSAYFVAPGPVWWQLRVTPNLHHLYRISLF